MPPAHTHSAYPPLSSVELFAGAGGLALGCEKAGFTSQAVVEWDKWACDTMRRNKILNHPLVKNWNIIESDVRLVDWSGIHGSIDLVAGGPPCQPFSMGGKAKAADDKRDMFPSATAVIAELQPRAFIIENVKGLTRSTFADYYRLIQLRLSFPELVERDNEDWVNHLKRLEEEERKTRHSGLAYTVKATLVNAADYGVPQQRHRVFLVGFRSDVSQDWRFPESTHSREALLHSQWVSEEYWERHRTPKARRPAAPEASTIAKLRGMDVSTLGSPWVTVRDALKDLPSPSPKGSPSVLNHVQQPGAKPYTGHTGSAIDCPAKALKAGGHGVPGGENMLLNPDGSVRYFTIRESARIQTFPDGYELQGSWSEAMRQLGNAVPVLLAERVAESVAGCLTRQ